jgi:hypothetical protein
LTLTSQVPAATSEDTAPIDIDFVTRNLERYKEMFNTILANAGNVAISNVI